MENKDNKTEVVDFESLKEFSNVLEKYPLIVSSVNENNYPNACIVSDYFVLDENRIVISVNEMIKTPDNVMQHSNVCLLCYDLDFSGIRLVGEASFLRTGEIYDLVVQKFKNEETNPKGAILIEVLKVEKF